jgi:hypothetical protein
VPAERMKADREHRVPLSDAALAVLAKVRPLGMTKNGEPDPAAPVFPGPRRALPMSNMTMLMLLRRMGRGDLTAHGFRSTFSDWAAERTAYPREVVEMALAHTVENKAERAYRRGDLFDKRRRLMADWARFCEAAASGEVVPLRAGGQDQFGGRIGSVSRRIGSAATIRAAELLGPSDLIRERRAKRRRGGGDIPPNNPAMLQHPRAAPSRHMPRGGDKLRVTSSAGRSYAPRERLIYESAERRLQRFSITIGRGPPTEPRERDDVGAVELDHHDAGTAITTLASPPHPLC